MKITELLTLRNALQFQLTYRQGEENKQFLRDVANFKLQYALRKNLAKLSKEADLVIDSIQGLKTDKEKDKAIQDAPDIEIIFHKIKFEEIPEDAPIDSGAMWVLEHFIEEVEPVKE